MACEEFRDRMMDVLYGEADRAAAREWDGHERACAACRDELRALRGVRRDLAQWAVQPAAAVPAFRPPRTWLAVAAALLAATAAVMVVNARADARIAEALRAQDESHRAALAAVEARLASRPAASAVALDDIQRLIRESESRQAVLIDAGLRDLAERTDAQRREDLAQISAGLSYVEGRTGLQVARTTELMGHVLQVAQQK
jgi:hypothetical protein